MIISGTTIPRVWSSRMSPVYLIPDARVSISTTVCCLRSTVLR